MLPFLKNNKAAIDGLPVRLIDLVYQTHLESEDRCDQYNVRSSASRRQD